MTGIMHCDSLVVSCVEIKRSCLRPSSKMGMRYGMLGRSYVKAKTLSCMQPRLILVLGARATIFYLLPTTTKHEDLASSVARC